MNKLSPQNTSQQSGKLHFVHIKQTHKFNSSSFGPSAEEINEVVRSQLNVIKEIRKRPHAIVMVEGTVETVHSDDPRPAKMRAYAKKLFPNSVPGEKELKAYLGTEEVEATDQALFLYQHGGALTLFMLGEIGSVYKAIHPEAAEKFSQQIKQGDLSSIFLLHEKEAIDCAKEAIIERHGSLNGSTVLAIFGGAHDFKPLCDQEGFSHESIETDPTIDYQKIAEYTKELQIKHS